jgi:protein TonB
MTSAAANSLLAPRPSKMAAWLVVSVAMHALLLGSAAILSWAYAGPTIDLDQKPIHASLVRKGKERDDKLLPRKEELPPPPAQEKAPEPVAVPTKPSPAAVAIDKPDPKPAPAAKKAEKVDGKKSLFDAFNKTGKATKPEELEGKADGDERGDSAVQEGERYYGLLKSIIKRNYDVSDSIPEAERITLRTVAVMKISAAGELLDAAISKPSGNALFDAAVLSAIKKTAPFPPPPDALKSLLAKGLTLNFTP